MIKQITKIIKRLPINAWDCMYALIENLQPIQSGLF